MATRAALRRLIGQRTQQPFFRDYGGTVGTATGGSTTTLIDTVRLASGDSLDWRGQFVYLPTTDEVRRITTFTTASDTVTWAAAATAVVNGTAYELWSSYTPGEVHAGLNYALSVAWPFLFLTGTNETVVIRQDGGLVYTLPTTNTIHRLCRVYLKAYYSTLTSTVTTEGTTSQVIDSTAPFTSADVGKWINVYDDANTANGNSRQILTFTSTTTVVVSSAFTVALPVGAKYRMVDKNYEFPTIILLQGWQPDKYDYPTTLWLGSHPSGYEGHLLCVEYEYDYPELTTETTDTTCPQEYILNMALAYLYFQRLGTADPSEVDRVQAMYQAALTAGQLYQKSNRFQHMPGTLTRMDLGAIITPRNYPF